MTPRRASIGIALCGVLLSTACGSSEAGVAEVPGTQASFALDGAFDSAETFYDFPYPSDLRLTDEGTPDVRGLPTPASNNLIDSLVTLVSQRKGFSGSAAAYFRFSAPMAAQSPRAVIPADATQALLLVEIEEGSPTRGTLHPLIAHTPDADAYVPENLLALAPMPGVVLRGGRRFAFVVRRQLGDAQGAPLGSPLALEQLKCGVAPAGARGEQALALYRPLWATLEQLGIDPAEVAAATVFTPGDMAAEMAALSDAVLARHEVTITDLTLAPGGDHARYCHLTGKMSMPQFQRGEPPFRSEGLLALDAEGVPQKTRDELLPVTITLPKQAMPTAGFPLGIYVHGSGGRSDEVVQRGPMVPPSTSWTPGEGPAFVLAPFGIAMASTAKPVNPERLPGASPYAYINPSNLPATRDLFRQGVIEERLFIRALEKLEIPASALGACAIPGDATSHSLDLRRLFFMGQSMGGMFTNLVAAVEPKVTAVVPTGAGGMWSYVLLESEMPLIAAARLLFGARSPSVAHPAYQILQYAWEPADPIAFVPRIGRSPLEGHAVRSIYQPAGRGDSFFPTTVYDAMAVAYGHQQAGDAIWSSMQQALAAVGEDGLASYPVDRNRVSGDGQTAYTSAIIQAEGDGTDPHDVAFQLEGIKYQYGCFLQSWIRAGVATIPAPAALGSPCP